MRNFNLLLNVILGTFMITGYGCSRTFIVIMGVNVILDGINIYMLKGE